jgi:hypothetical protein
MTTTPLSTAKLALCFHILSDVYKLDNRTGVRAQGSGHGVRCSAFRNAKVPLWQTFRSFFAFRFSTTHYPAMAPKVANPKRPARKPIRRKKSGSDKG